MGKQAHAAMPHRDTFNNQPARGLAAEDELIGKAVSAVGGKKTSAAESTASTSSSLSSPEVRAGGLMA
jgi:hypothetical protein